MSMQKVTLVPINKEDRNQFILDCQESFRYGSLEEFGERNVHLDKDGEVMPRHSIEAVLDSPTAESYHIVQEGKRMGGLVIDLDAANRKGELTLLFTRHATSISMSTVAVSTSWSSSANVIPTKDRMRKMPMNWEGRSAFRRLWDDK